MPGPLDPPGSSQGALSFVGDAIGGAPMRSDLLTATPYEQSWTLGLQRELPGGFIAEANYIGKTGTKLYFGGSGNWYNIGSFRCGYGPAASPGGP